jgi:hypothetical protein
VGRSITLPELSGVILLRTLLGLSLSLTFTSLLAGAHAATLPNAPITITFADQPVHLVRHTSVYSAGRGVQLQANDMLESTSGAIQLEAGGTTVAIGPATHVFVKDGSELVLLDGWLKVTGGVTQAPQVGTAALQFASAGTSVDVHATADATELFAESGDVLVNELAGGKPLRQTRLPHDQYAVRSGSQPLRLMPRPPAAFLAAMPRVFKDTLVPITVKGGAVAPKRDRAATFAELAPWLSAQPALRRQVQRRFEPPHRARPAPVERPNELQ